MRFHPLVAACAGLLFMAAIPALVKHSAHGGPTTAESEQHNDIAKTDPARMLVPGAAYYQPGANFTQDDQPHQPSYEQPDPTTTNWIQALSGVAVAVFTFFLWQLQGRQVRLTEGALRESAKSADAALATADHAASSANAAVKALELEHRPVLFVDDFRTEPFDARDGRDYLLYRAVWRNVSKSPATIIESAFMRCMADVIHMRHYLEQMRGGEEQYAFNRSVVVLPDKSVPTANSLLIRPSQLRLGVMNIAAPIRDFVRGVSFEEEEWDAAIFLSKVKYVATLDPESPIYETEIVHELRRNPSEDAPGWTLDWTAVPDLTKMT